MAIIDIEKLPYDIFRPDRPGWIPEWVGDDWDQNPYAYQNREELMPAGHTHNLYLITLAQMLAPHLQQHGLYTAVDVFLFYRDWEGRKQRIAPDALIAPIVELSPEQQLKSYDLDDEALPLCVVEITSESSKASDLQRKRLFYASLGISEYLLIDILDDENPDLLKLQIDLHLWQLQKGLLLEIAPDEEDFLHLESIGVRIRADGQQLVAQVIATGEMLRTTTELREALAAADQARREADQARREAEQARREAEQSQRTAEQARHQEQQARRAAEQAQRAAEKKAADEGAARREAEQQAADEAAARQRAEAELAQLRAELARLRTTDPSP